MQNVYIYDICYETGSVVIAMAMINSLVNCSEKRK
jgi:hypothetical protein